MIARLRAIFTIVEMVITVTITIILMYTFKSKNRTFRRVWASMQMKLLGIKLDVVGDIDPDADMLVMNHQSILDIMVFEYLHPKNLAWVAKKEIADIPWFGHILKAPDMIIVERESKSSLVKLLKESKEKLKQKRPIAIFPEGTRSDGGKIRKFKAGAKMIANKYELKVQPVVLVGTREILDSQNFRQNSGVVKVIYLPVIEAKKGEDWYEKLEIDMKEILSKELNSGI
ncbi:MAG: lysophospholipid acyltransferase family protein [Campylobacterota bacterium]|nr:lysophospholipid acyltransferase family protein [Campylobacterota bacterium]